jgi:GNAT superfamily N-acetyltransferase
MTKIYSGDWKSWPGEVRKILRSLTKRSDSGLQAQIHKMEEETPHRTFLLMENETLVGWASACYDPEYHEYDIMLYVRSDKRNMGFGRQLFKRAKQWVQRQGSQYFFFPDPSNKGFFESVAPEKF